MGDYRRLKVWQKARQLRSAVYSATEAFPVDERYGSRAQIRRASSSIMGNIAEGCGRNRDRELLRFLSIALGSASELENHLAAARDEAFLDATLATRLISQTAEIKRMLAGLSARLRRDLDGES